MDEKDKDKNFLSKKWVKTLLILSFPLFWPFYSGIFITTSVLKQRLSKKIKLLCLGLVSLPLFLFGTIWVLALFFPTEKKPAVRGTAISQTTPTHSVTPTFTPSTTPTPKPKEKVQEIKKRLVKVTRIIDGDTIEIETGQRVRYIGIDTPEMGYYSKQKECFSQEATNKNKELVFNKKVLLEKDVSETDRYGRLLRYVWVGDQLINEVLVKEGYARIYTKPPDIKYQELFLKAERSAREESKGLWSGCKYFGEPLSKPTIRKAGSSENRRCFIKGNISYKTGEKIYHLPGCPYYEATKINKSKGERYFCTEEEAIAAGWRKAKNCP